MARAGGEYARQNTLSGLRWFKDAGTQIPNSIDCMAAEELLYVTHGLKTIWFSFAISGGARQTVTRLEGLTTMDRTIREIASGKHGNSKRVIAILVTT
jgi:hypothetical protein